MKKRIISAMLAVCLLLSISSTVFAADNAEKWTDAAAAYILQTVDAPTVGSIGGEWAVIGLARSGTSVPQSYWDAYYQRVLAYVAEKEGDLHGRKYTEYSRVALALTAIGADPRNVGGYDLLVPLGDFEKTVWQGINGPVWALIALDSGRYSIPVNPEAAVQATRQMYVDEILACQLKDGGWNLKDRGGTGSADADVTGMVLQALAGYKTQPKVAAAIDRALACLSTMQQANGGFSSYGTASAESIAQVLAALSALDIAVSDRRFVKNGNTLLDALGNYRLPSGGFKHTADGTVNMMATEQSLCALAAHRRAKQGKHALYDMTDTSIHVTGVIGTIGLPDKNAAVQKQPVISSTITFADVQGHTNQSAIEALAARSIINGKSSTIFDPDNTMTRAEFAAIVVRGLGLPRQETAQFSDVKSGVWYTPYVGAAYAYGIVNGRSVDLFDPGGTITRQEAAVMVARAARLCGMDTAMDAAAVRNMLAQFGDYRTIAAWASESMAFCYAEDILNQSDLNTLSTRAILRCEIAQMLYNLLSSARLL